MNESCSENDAKVAQEVINMECAALDRWGKGDPSGFLEIYASDIVYFDPSLERRIDGLDSLTEYYERIRGKIHIDRFELLNPLVQVVGDAAILTFNYASYGAEGKPSPWNCTEVYRRKGNQWEIIQTHWSYTIAKRA